MYNIPQHAYVFSQKEKETQCEGSCGNRLQPGGCTDFPFNFRQLHGVSLMGTVHDIPQLREHTGVFRDRKHAGQVLAQMLAAWKGGKAAVFAIPSGGVPVAVEVAQSLALPLDVAVVSKILLPWDTEAGFGAVGFDGSVWINEEYAAYYGLDKPTIEQQTRAAMAKVQRRVKLFRGDRQWPELANRAVILVDDGIAAGSTMRVALAALRNAGPGKIIVAVPSSHHESLGRITKSVEELYCPNIRSGRQFAVASAYRLWDDVDEAGALRLVRFLIR